VTQPPGSTDLYVVERAGTIRVVRGGTILERPFLDIRATIGGPPTGGNEWGLLGLAFHPNYSENGRFFVTYTPLDGDNVLAEGTRKAANPDEANGTLTPILSIDDFAPNHNGGMIVFGSDGFLYYGTGDGGGGGDPQRTAQDLNSLLGKILRLDVQTAGSYTVPASNPFVGMAGSRGEIWSYGLRNPWRFSFDRANGDLWIGDVGQELWEEIDYATPESAKGANFGWSRYEGTHDYSARPLMGPSPHHAPIYEYPHDEGSSVVGGYVYRGRAIPSLVGTYLFADSYSDFVRAMRVCDGAITRAAVDTSGLGGGPIPGAGLVSFAEDNDGELYLVYLGSGQVMRITGS
jgi:glucose/arabinose dehydrogenase